MAVSEKSEQATTPEERVESRDSADNPQHREILSAAEAAQQDAVHIKLSWRSWVSLARSLLPSTRDLAKLTPGENRSWCSSPASRKSSPPSTRRASY